MAPAILLEEFPIITNGKVQTRYGTVSGYGYGDSMGVEMDYTYTGLSSWTHNGLIVSTVNLEELKNEIETFLISGAEMPGGFPVYLECIHMSAFRMEGLFVFDRIVDVEYARRVMSNLARFLNTYWKYRQYGFRCQYTCRFAGTDGYIPFGSGTIITGGGSNSSGTSSPPFYPLVEKIIYDEGNLTSKQLEQLNEAIQEAINHNCYIEAAFNYLTKKECQFSSVKIDPSLQGSGGNSVLLDGEGNPVRVILKFGDGEYICARTFSHELIHLLQIEQGMYEGLDSRGMMEYERVLIDDIVFYSKFKGKIERATYEDWQSKLYPLVCGEFYKNELENHEEWDKQQTIYKDWLSRLTKKGNPESITDSDFREWSSLFYVYDRSYSITNGYKYNESYGPIVLNKILGLIKENCK